MTEVRKFPADPQSVSAARHFVTEVLSGSPPEVLDAVELMVSELATNAVGHVQTSFELTLSRTAQEIRVEVRDDGGGTPAIRAPAPDDPRGRGLRIVDGLADRWGVTYHPPAGKIVWFTLVVPAADTVTEQGSSSSSPDSIKRTPRPGPAVGDQRQSPRPPAGPDMSCTASPSRDRGIDMGWTRCRHQSAPAWPSWRTSRWALGRRGLCAAWSRAPGDRDWRKRSGPRHRGG